MRIAVTLHPTRPTSVEVAKAVADAAGARGIDVVVAPGDIDRLPAVAPWREDIAVDVVVAIGGDGTVLEAARMARAWDAAVLGVNAGTVGYLAEVEPASIGSMLDRLQGGDYMTSTRMTLDAVLPDGSIASALNDIVVEKANSRHVVGIAVSVAGERLVQYRTDAVIVATPTGSTAYTFSAGGPLVDPEMEALLVTAVAPHNLFGRPLVFSPEVELTVTVVSDRNAHANADGRRVADLIPGDTVTVRRGTRPTRLIRFSPSNFARTVKEKFRLHDA